MTFSLPYLQALLLLSVRHGAALWVIPAFSLAALPMPARLGLAVLVSMAMLPAALQTPEIVDGLLVLAIGMEVVLGLALGMVVNVAFAAVRAAGALADTYLGFTMAAMMDPVGHADSGGPLATVSGMLSTVLFFLLNAHHQVLLALGKLAVIIPPGTWNGALSGTAVGDLGAGLFEAAVRLTVPLLAVSLLTDAGLGLASRMVPQLQPMFLGAPLKTVTGLTLLVLMLPAWGAAVAALFQVLPMQMGGLFPR